jgi:hypothetical protein
MMVISMLIKEWHIKTKTRENTGGNITKMIEAKINIL